MLCRAKNGRTGQTEWVRTEAPVESFASPFVGKDLGSLATALTEATERRI